MTEEMHEGRVFFTRIIDAPVDLAFRAWVDPQQVAQWWGPDGFTAPECEIDARPGGRIYMVMKPPGGDGFAWTGEYLEFVENEKLVFTNNPIGPNGEPLALGHTTVTFRDLGSGKTELKVDSTSRAKWAGMFEGMEAAWSQQTDRYAAFLASR